VVSLVVAHARGGVIGRDGGLPWHLPGDMRWFRELTTGGTVLMGRTTYASLPDAYRPLPGRRNLVLTSRPDDAPDGAEAFGTLAAALDACGHDCFVIGGDRTYREALPLAQRVYATEIDADVDGDAFFAPLDPAAWRLVAEREPVLDEELPFTIRTYDRAA
jgi:dihydrofolate reductase